MWGNSFKLRTKKVPKKFIKFLKKIKTEFSVPRFVPKTEKKLRCLFCGKDIEKKHLNYHIKYEEGLEW